MSEGVSDYDLGFLAGVNESTQAVLLETKAWLRAAATTTGNEKIVAVAIANALADLTARLTEQSNKFLTEAHQRAAVANDPS